MRQRRQRECERAIDAGKTKQTVFSTSISNTTTIEGSAPAARSAGGVTMVSEYDRSRSASPRSTRLTTSLVSPSNEDFEGNTYVNNVPVHIYDNVATVIGDSLKRANGANTSSDSYRHSRINNDF